MLRISGMTVPFPYKRPRAARFVAKSNHLIADHDDRHNQTVMRLSRIVSTLCKEYFK